LTGDPTANEGTDNETPTPNPSPNPTPTPTPTPTPEENYPASCIEPLKKRGFVPWLGKWTKKIKTACGTTGVGYVEGEVTVDPAILCPQLPSNYEYALDHVLTNAENQSPDIAPVKVPVPAGVSYKAGPHHCKGNNRCASPLWGTSRLIGRWAWMVKCENQVPAFKEFLDSMRGAENCSGKVIYGKLCLFNNDTQPAQANYYPDLKMESEIPAPAVEFSGKLTKLDDLAAPAIQNQITLYPCPSPSSVSPIDSICSSGCYRGDQRILLSKTGKYQDILGAHRAQAPLIAVLTQDSTIDNVKLTSAPVGRFVVSKEDSAEVLLQFETRLGIRLVVTTNHPLLDSSGIMREASQFKIGDQLFRVDGRADTIKAIKKQNFYGKVYNVAPVSIDPSDNLIIAEGIVNGSHNFQTELQSHINRVVLRSHLSRGY
jgi:hypothetical protein